MIIQCSGLRVVVKSVRRDLVSHFDVAVAVPQLVASREGLRGAQIGGSTFVDHHGVILHPTTFFQGREIRTARVMTKLLLLLILGLWCDF